MCHSESTDAVLRQWINPQYLSSHSTSVLRERLVQSPDGLLVIQDFLRPDKAEALGRFLEFEAQFEVVHALHAQTGAGFSSRGTHVGAQDWNTVPVENRLFRFERARMPDTYSEASATFLQYLHDATGTAFRCMWEEISQQSLGDCHVEAHRMREADFVGPHTDARNERRFGLVQYFTPDAQRGEGGVLVFKTSNGREIEVVPRFNLFVIFDVERHAHHRVSHVKGDWHRLTINGWYLRCK